MVADPEMNQNQDHQLTRFYSECKNSLGLDTYWLFANVQVSCKSLCGCNIQILWNLKLEW